MNDRCEYEDEFVHQSRISVRLHRLDKRIAKLERRLIALERWAWPPPSVFWARVGRSLVKGYEKIKKTVDKRGG